ncbi:phosphotransferase [uncultured Phycicoccus sp.]|uniref:phosphotransferase n=1 Tax=uncultured Phycicoccus sp. TaxID=661422 RepID=UPI00261BF580|nr:phosphotransferase [uncultured Phycicoccus sp.]
MRDLPALWSSPQWQADLQGWLVPALAAAGLTPTGPVVQDRVRFWSTVLHVETDAGRVWVKQNAPSQAFEAALAEVVHARVPGVVATPLAVSAERGLLASADLGPPLWDDDVPPVRDWVEVLGAWARCQVALAEHGAEVLAAGVPRFPEPADAVLAWVGEVLAWLAGLPEDDPRRATDEDCAVIDAGLHRIADAADLLAGGVVPPSLQHNDLHLGNAMRRPDGGFAVIDLGDALWAHPLTSARIPLWVLRHRLGSGPGELAAAEAAYLAPWADVADPAALRRLLPEAERISCLHRAESWRRLQADVPVSVVDEDYVHAVVEWLRIAAAEDPYAEATGGS